MKDRPRSDVKILSQIAAEAETPFMDKKREEVGIAAAQYRLHVLHFSKKQMARELRVSEKDLTA